MLHALCIDIFDDLMLYEVLTQVIATIGKPRRVNSGLNALHVLVGACLVVEVKLSIVHEAVEDERIQKRLVGKIGRSCFTKKRTKTDHQVR